MGRTRPATDAQNGCGHLEPFEDEALDQVASAAAASIEAHSPLLEPPATLSSMSARASSGDRGMAPTAKPRACFSSLASIPAAQGGDATTLARRFVRRDGGMGGRTVGLSSGSGCSGSRLTKASAAASVPARQASVIGAPAARAAARAPAKTSPLPIAARGRMRQAPMLFRSPPVSRTCTPHGPSFRTHVSKCSGIRSRSIRAGSTVNAWASSAVLPSSAPAGKAGALLSALGRVPPDGQAGTCRTTKARRERCLGRWTEAAIRFREAIDDFSASRRSQVA
jgi:hypothetical protein